LTPCDAGILGDLSRNDHGTSGRQEIAIDLAIHQDLSARRINIAIHRPGNLDPFAIREVVFVDHPARGKDGHLVFTRIQGVVRLRSDRDDRNGREKWNHPQN
jgi:hypothetical protein